MQNDHQDSTSSIGRESVGGARKQCPQCDASYARTAHLNRHMKTHLKDRLYVCELCEAQFVRNDVLMKHRKGCAKRQARAKSCRACANSKAACDVCMPCARCVVEGINCVYPRPHPAPTELDPPHIPISVSASVDWSPDIWDLRFVGASTNPAPSESVASSSTAPVDIDFGALYTGNMFDGLFSGLFSDGIPGLPAGNDNLQPLAENPSMSMFPFDTATAAPTVAPPDAAIPTPNDQEIAHYESLFYSDFLAQMPAPHPATFPRSAKHPLLVEAMRVCGALCMRTPRADAYVLQTMGEIRAGLMKNFSRYCVGPSKDLATLTQLLMAANFVQAAGLFHQQTEERANAVMFHGLIVMMVRRSELIERTQDWKPLYPEAIIAVTTGHLSADDPDLERTWLHWAEYETRKRALAFTYLHDLSQMFYFGLGGSYAMAEMAGVRVPCEDALWTAPSAGAWAAALCQPSVFGAPPDRLRGVCTLGGALARTQDLRRDEQVLTPLGYCLAVHAILADLFAVCDEFAGATGEQARLCKERMYTAHFALHNWLAGWMRLVRSGEGAGAEAGGADDAFEPHFYVNCLPLYWLGQLALVALQQDEALIDQSKKCIEETEQDVVEVQYRMVRRWLGRIKAFLRQNRQKGGDCGQQYGEGGAMAPTVLWDGVMQIRLEVWREEREELGIVEKRNSHRPIDSHLAI